MILFAISRKKIYAFGVILLLALLGASLYYVNLTKKTSAIVDQAFNWVLGGKIIAIDPGHGGYDPGAKGSAGTLEKDLNLAIGLVLKKVLEQGGAQVVMTRETDEDLVTPGEGTMKFQDLQNRLKLIQTKNADLLISIHLNSSGSRWRGAQVFYHPKDEINKELATAIQAGIKLQLQNTHRQPLPLASSFLLKEVSIPAVIVEAGFITNPEEEKLLKDDAYQVELAKGIAKGILDFLNK